MEPVTGQLNNTIAAKLTAVEVTLKDNVIKVVKSKVRVQSLVLFFFLLFFLFYSLHCSTLMWASFIRTLQTPSVELCPRPCRAPSRLPIKTPSRAPCCLSLKEASSPCFSKSTKASSWEHKNVRHQRLRWKTITAMCKVLNKGIILPENPHQGVSRVWHKVWIWKQLYYLNYLLSCIHPSCRTFKICHIVTVSWYSVQLFYRLKLWETHTLNVQRNLQRSVHVCRAFSQ